MLAKKCRWCGNPQCPYPTDEDYARAKAEKWGGNPDNKECWMPIPENIGVLHDENGRLLVEVNW